MDHKKDIALIDFLEKSAQSDSDIALRMGVTKGRVWQMKNNRENIFLQNPSINGIGPIAWYAIRYENQPKKAVGE